MILSRILSIALVAALIACSPKSNETSTDKDSLQVGDELKPGTAGFADFLSALPRIKLPYEVYCEKCCDHPDLEKYADLVSRYVPEGATVVGLIFQNERHAGILVTYAADMFIPSVVVYDKTGKITSEEKFLTAWCGRDVDYVGLQYLTITSEKSIVETDTSYSLEIDSLASKILDTTKTEVSRKNFFVDNDGRITQGDL